MQCCQCMLQRNWILLWSFEHVLLVIELPPAELVLIWQVAELLIGLQLDTVPLITSLSAQQFNQFSTHPTILISSPHFISLSMKMLCQRVLKTETLIKGKANHIHCSTLIYQASNFVTKGYDIDQAWFPVSKSMLIVSNNPHVLNKFGNGIQSYVFHPFAWETGEANQPKVLWILLPVLAAVKSDHFFQSSGISPDIMII